MIVIEVDGGQHLESQRDAMRDRYLREQGYCVLGPSPARQVRATSPRKGRGEVKESLSR
jgi:very-short-patch-repair endonuclease